VEGEAEGEVSRYGRAERLVAARFCELHRLRRRSPSTARPSTPTSAYHPGGACACQAAAPVPVDGTARLLATRRASNEHNPQQRGWTSLSRHDWRPSPDRRSVPWVRHRHGSRRERPRYGGHARGRCGRWQDVARRLGRGGVEAAERGDKPFGAGQVVVAAMIVALRAQPALLGTLPSAPVQARSERRPHRLDLGRRCLKTTTRAAGCGACSATS
jgi:hypothetical protein